jgi:hypothetical protein
MATSNEVSTPILLIKKLAGVFLLVMGALLTATGTSAGYSGLTIIGWILLAAGIALLVMKILRRNQH